MATSRVFPVAEYSVVCDSWTLKGPTTILGIGKFGLRQGHVFVLSLRHEGHDIVLPILIDQAHMGCFAHKNGADYLTVEQSERYLSGLSSSASNGPLLVKVEEWNLPPDWNSRVSVTDLALTAQHALQSDAAWSALMAIRPFQDDDTPYLDPLASALLFLLVALLFASTLYNMLFRQTK